MKTFHKKIKLRNKEEALVGFIAKLFYKRGKEYPAQHIYFIQEKKRYESRFWFWIYRL